MAKHQLVQQFESQNLFTLWERIRFWFFVRKIRRAKIYQIWECNLDKLFFQANFFTELAYVDTEDRKELEKLHKVPFDQQEKLQIGILEERITRSKAIKDAYRRTTELGADLDKYVGMLNLWDGSYKEEDDAKADDSGGGSPL